MWMGANEKYRPHDDPAVPETFKVVAFEDDQIRTFSPELREFTAETGVMDDNEVKNVGTNFIFSASFCSFLHFTNTRVSVLVPTSLRRSSAVFRFAEVSNLNI